MIQDDLLDWKPPAEIMGDRDGATYDSDRDLMRLDNAMGRIFRYIQDRQWHTLAELADAGICSEACASARLRDLRKPKFSAGRPYYIDRSHAGRGLYKYMFAGRAPEPTHVLVNGKWIPVQDGAAR